MKEELVAGIDEQIAYHNARVLELADLRVWVARDPDLFATMIEKSEAVFGFMNPRWLCDPNRFLGDRSPLQAVIDGDLAQVELHLVRIQTGVF